MSFASHARRVSSFFALITHQLAFFRYAGARDSKNVCAALFLRSRPA
jgi:hypothetical protein